ncbi:probable LRR receptor-like serine/threonine-protein kinase At3g47570 [Rosa rugosa]|uniref:probable LRR receptor-like serine/threonine-protein kinase At3g47570 n=1 Tax=Rosa rugosa TaxID=74645 RepID=UPI002B410EBA|nr:probable LRR receptor-like serine/threonine-protein kinase At3g47570 [Rosa rugosa]
MESSVLKLILILSAISVCYCSSSMQPSTARLEGNEMDRVGLLAIKANIQHDPNQVTSTWNDSIHFCYWHGVTCSPRHQQRVTKLDLSSQSLAGSISPHVGNLSFLSVLRLYNNSFSREIPLEMGNLRRLQERSLLPWGTLRLSRHLLFLNYNNLVGSIPTSLDALNKLTFFSVALNNLSGTIPPSIFNMSTLLTFFSIGQNQIQGSLPTNLGKSFPRLQFFRITLILFTGYIPHSISNAKDLWTFQVQGNRLTGQVPDLQKLHNLGRFNIEANQLGMSKYGDLSFLSGLSNATMLESLILSDNNFGGTLPTSISNLTTKLKELQIEGNQLRTWKHPS